MTINHDVAVEMCARAAHEANRSYCAAIGDLSQPSWEDAPDWQKESARNGVEGVIAGKGPRESHAAWMAEKFAADWKWGPVKRPDFKEHPCLVAYDDLPPEQRSKDDLYVTTVRSMLTALGLWCGSTACEIVGFGLSNGAAPIQRDGVTHFTFGNLAADATIRIGDATYRMEVITEDAQAFAKDISDRWRTRPLQP